MPDPSAAIGPYQLQGQLGAGGMGEVYRAADTRVGRQVALKILPDSFARDEERRRRFEQEARLAASLNHPNIVAIYDVGLDQRPPYNQGPQRFAGNQLGDDRTGQCFPLAT
jgi:serine/threonine protein kinase